MFCLGKQRNKQTWPGASEDAVYKRPCGRWENISYVTFKKVCSAEFDWQPNLRTMHENLEQLKCLFVHFFALGYKYYWNYDINFLL